MHVSSHWPREGTKLVKVAFKTGDTVTQYAVSGSVTSIYVSL